MDNNESFYSILTKSANFHGGYLVLKIPSKNLYNVSGVRRSLWVISCRQCGKSINTNRAVARVSVLTSNCKDEHQIE